MERVVYGMNRDAARGGTRHLTRETYTITLTQNSKKEKKKTWSHSRSKAVLSVYVRPH